MSPSDDSGWPRAVARAADAALESTVVGSFTRLGYDVRRRAFGWTRVPRLDGRRVLITGATSGLGLAAARRLAALGADLVLVARNEVKADAAAQEMLRLGASVVDVVLADLADLSSVAGAAAELVEDGQPLHAVVHNAGALTAEHTVTRDGLELTVQTHLVAPHLLTRLLQPLLRAGSRVVFVTSGGMYSERLDVDRLQMGAEDHRGSVAYARAKRAQVAAMHEWSDRLAPTGVVVHAMHPGWADTPGVAASLPRFRRMLRPLLRTPDEGADTMVWLVAGDDAGDSTGRLWLDRRPRAEHRLPATRRSDEAQERGRLWSWLEEVTGGALPGGGSGR